VTDLGVAVSPDTHDVSVGRRLRSIRRQKGLSLHDVQDRSEMEFKASVLGAYERGERAISVPRLLRLAQLYGVPADQLLPGGMTAGRAARSERDSSADGFTVDLERLARAEGGEAAVLRRFVERVQLQRQDFNGRVLTIRGDDMRLLATILGRSQAELEAHLDELGLRADLGGS
jgi:transcriptional regulator with XRE-family HTH domain